MASFSSSGWAPADRIEYRGHHYYNITTKDCQRAVKAIQETESETGINSWWDVSLDTSGWEGPGWYRLDKKIVRYSHGRRDDEYCILISVATDHISKIAAVAQAESDVADFQAFLTANDIVTGYAVTNELEVVHIPEPLEL